MSSTVKNDRPLLEGQRIKSRKRDEKEKQDPIAFRDSILAGINDIVGGASPIHTALAPSPKPSPVEETAGQLDDLNIIGDEAETVVKPVVDEVPITNGSAINVTPVVPSPGQPGLVTVERLDKFSKWLDERGSRKDDFRRYGEVLFDIMIAGGILAPGGNIMAENENARTNFCVFGITENEENNLIKSYASVIQKLVRRYKYLEKVLDEEFKKITKFLKGFTDDERAKLSKITGILISQGMIPCSVLLSAIYDPGVKEGISGTFLISCLKEWNADGKDLANLWSQMKKATIDTKIFEFFPMSKRSPENLESALKAAGLGQLMDYQRAGLGDKAKKVLASELSTLIRESTGSKDLIPLVKESMTNNHMSETEVVLLLWSVLMNAVDWSKKEDLVEAQAIKHLSAYAPLLLQFTSTKKSEMALINRIQEFSYENMNFLKAFSKIIQIFYQKDVLSEETIIKWHKDAHSNKGKSIFLEQTKKFVEWLQTADEESEEEED